MGLFDDIEVEFPMPDDIGVKRIGRPRILTVKWIT